jgi:hypothetical protein
MHHTGGIEYRKFPIVCDQVRYGMVNCPHIVRKCKDRHQTLQDAGPNNRRYRLNHCHPAQPKAFPPQRDIMRVKRPRIQAKLTRRHLVFPSEGECRVPVIFRADKIVVRDRDIFVVPEE